MAYSPQTLRPSKKIVVSHPCPPPFWQLPLFFFYYLLFSYKTFISSLKGDKKHQLERELERLSCSCVSSFQDIEDLGEGDVFDVFSSTTNSVRVTRQLSCRTMLFMTILSASTAAEKSTSRYPLVAFPLQLLREKRKTTKAQSYESLHPKNCCRKKLVRSSNYYPTTCLI